MDITSQQFQRIIRQVHPNATLNKTWSLTGGISAQTIALDFIQSDGTQGYMVFRQHGEVDRRRNPNIAEDEYKLLSILHQLGLAIPQPYYVDSSKAIVSLPYLLIEYIDASPLVSLDDHLNIIPQLAQHLANIHHIDLTQHDLTFLPSQADLITAHLDSSSQSDNRIVHALRPIHPLPQVNDERLLHGDYWLGNLLWKDGQLVSIIDWEDAMIGDPLGDLGKSRLELLWAVGDDMMRTYTHQYQALMPTLDMTYLAFWDLWGALRLAGFETWFEDTATVKRMTQQYDHFVDQAIQRLHRLQK